MIEQKIKKQKKYSYNLINPHLGRIFVARLFDLIFCSIPTLMLVIFNNILNWQTLLINILISQTIYFLYFVLLPYFFKGNTLGKLIFNLRLKNNNNEIKKIKFKIIFLREFYFLYIPLIFQLITQTIIGVIIFTVPKNENIDFTLKIISNLGYLFLGIWFIYVPLTIYLQSEHISAIDLRLNTCVKYLEKTKLKNDDNKENKIHVHLKDNLPGTFNLQEVNDLIVSRDNKEGENNLLKIKDAVINEYDFLKNLNNDELQAIEIIDKPLQIRKSSNVEKTKIIISKILYLIYLKNYDPKKILAIAFTNKTIEEINESVCQYLKDDDKPLISTVHFLCSKILYEDGINIGVDSLFQIIDNKKQEKILKEIFEKYNLEKDEEEKIESFIRKIKYVDTIRLEKTKTLNDEDDCLIKQKIFKEYGEYKKNYNLFDFNDLLIYTIKLFLSYEGIKNKWANKFSYILVDEVQYLNDDQIKIINLLNNNANQITIMGNVDQNINGQNDFLLNFENYYSNQITINLD